jgi:zinc protease
MTLNRTEVPSMLNATDFNFVLSDITQTHLQNGIPFYYLNAGTQEVVNVDFIFMAGKWQQSAPAVAQAVFSLLKNGTASKSALQINEMIEFYGASVKCNVGTDFSSIVVSCLSKHLHQILPLVFELITESVFSENELAIFKQTTTQMMKVSLKKCDFVGNRKIDEFLFGRNHPYGAYNELSDIEVLQQKQLLDFRQQHLRFDSCKIFLAGKFNVSIIKDIETIFGTTNWNESSIMAPLRYTIQAEPQKKHRIANDENGVQGAVRLSRDFVTKTHQDFVPMIVVNTLFGSYFGSRLMSNIREEKGYTYGIYSYIYNNMHEGGIGIATEAGKDVCEATVQEIYNEMAILRNEKVDDEELQLVKNYILGGLLGDLDGPFQIMQRWKNLIINGFTKDRFDSNIEIYKSITSQQIQELANKYLVDDAFYELIVI